MSMFYFPMQDTRIYDNDFVLYCVRQISCDFTHCLQIFCDYLFYLGFVSGLRRNLKNTTTPVRHNRSISEQRDTPTSCSKEGLTKQNSGGSIVGETELF